MHFSTTYNQFLNSTLLYTRLHTYKVTSTQDLCSPLCRRGERKGDTANDAGAIIFIFDYYWVSTISSDQLPIVRPRHNTHCCVWHVDGQHSHCKVRRVRLLPLP